MTVRIKPSKVNEDKKANSNLQDCWRVYKEPHNVISNLRSKQNYIFDYVFAEDSNNEHIFRILAQPLIESSLEGINCTIFAYGQTSSGKTYTIRGSAEEPGLIIQSLKFIFDSIKPDPGSFSIKISYLEVYNEQINDLLDASKTNLEIREHPEKGIFVDKLSEFIADSEARALELLALGESHRKTAETQMNLLSSRSHSVFKIVIENSNPFISKVAQLNFVDLAGSEGMAKAKTEDLRLKEGSNINKSLLSLSSVIQRLSETKGAKGYINFRDSKMTRLLQPALSGNFRTAVICTVNPESSHYQESNNTLLFGVRAKLIKNDVKINQIYVNEQHMNEISEENKKLVEKVCELEKSYEDLQRVVLDLQVRDKERFCLLQIVQQEGLRKSEVIVELENLVKSWQDKCDEAGRNVEELYKKVGAYFAKNNEDAEVIRQLNGKNEFLNTQNKNNQAYLDLVIGEINDFKGKVVLLEGVADGLRKDLQCKDAEIQRELEIKAKLQNEVLGLGESLEFVRGELKEEKERNCLMNRMIEELRESFDQSIQENKRLSSCCEGLNEKLSESLETNSILSGKLEDSSIHISNQLQKISIYENQITSLTQSLDSEQLKSKSNFEMFERSNDQVNSLSLKCESLANELSAANQNIIQLTSTLSSTEKVKENLDHQLKIQISKSDSLQTSLNELQLTSQTKFQEYENLIQEKNQEIQNLQKPSHELLKKSQEFQQLKEDLHTKNNQIQELQEKLDFYTQENKSLTEITVFKTKLLKELHDQLKDSIKKQEALESANHSLTTENNSLVTSKKSLSLELVSLNECLNSSDLQITSLKSQISSQNQRISDLNREISRLNSEKSALHQEIDLQVSEKNLIEAEKYELEFRISDNSVLVHPLETSSQSLLSIIKEKVEVLNKYEELHEDFLKLQEKYEQVLANNSSLNYIIEEKDKKLKNMKSDNLHLEEKVLLSEKKNKEIVRQLSVKRSSLGIVDKNIMDPLENGERYKFKLALSTSQCEIKNLNDEVSIIIKEKEMAIRKKEEIEKEFEVVEKLKKELVAKNEELVRKNIQLQQEVNYLVSEKEMKLYDVSSDRFGSNEKESRKEVKFMNLGSTPKCKTQ